MISSLGIVQFNFTVEREDNSLRRNQATVVRCALLESLSSVSVQYTLTVVQEFKVNIQANTINVQLLDLHIISVFKVSSVRHNLKKLLWTHLLWPIQLVGVLVEQIEGLCGALPLVHVTCDENALHAHLQLPGTFPSLGMSGPVPFLASFPRVVSRSRHVCGSFVASAKQRRATYLFLVTAPCLC